MRAARAVVIALATGACAPAPMPKPAEPVANDLGTPLAGEGYCRD